MTKRYLGDAVWVDIDDIGSVVLTTQAGLQVTNTIWLIPTSIAP